jgi:hypothetical protein
VLLVALPAALVTVILPVVAPTGTRTVSAVSVADVTVAAVPLKATVFSDADALKPEPKTVTGVPVVPLGGVKSTMRSVPGARRRIAVMFRRGRSYTGPLFHRLMRPERAGRADRRRSAASELPPIQRAPCRCLVIRRAAGGQQLHRECEDYVTSTDSHRFDPWSRVHDRYIRCARHGVEFDSRAHNYLSRQYGLRTFDT